LCQGKAEERDDAVASLIDDNAALAQIVGAHCCDIYARLYKFRGLGTTAEGVRFA